MTQQPQPRANRRPAARIRPELRGLLVVAVLAVALCGIIALLQSGSDGGGRTLAQSPPGAPADAVVPTTAASPVAGVTGGTGSPTTAVAGAAGTASTVAGATAEPTADLDGDEPTATGACTITERSVRLGDTNASVSCLQQALVTSGLLTSASGTFDSATQEAVRKLQTQKDMFVDGVVGRETALSLGIWPDEQSLVVRTPAPPKGAKDLLGYTLSPVASAGDDAPPLPENSGTGRRLVYSRSGQRVWAVDGDGRILRSWLVSGSKYNNETPGVHKVYSRSEQSTAWNGKAILPRMVRWLKTDIGAIGFHGIPVHVSDGSPYQTHAELGTRLSGGCQRQDNLDAAFVWAWAQVGTPVVVI